MSSISAEQTRASAPAWRAARYRKMLHAATEALRTQPPEAVSMDEIATAARVGKATLYRYFESKEALLRACLYQVVDDVGRRMEAAERAAGDPPERLRRIVDTMVESFSRDLMPLRLITRSQSDLEESWRQSALDARRRLVRVLRQHFDRGVASGWYADIDRDLVPHMIMGMIRSGVTHAAGKSLEDVSDGVCAFVLRACLVSDPGALHAVAAAGRAPDRKEARGT